MRKGIIDTVKCEGGCHMLQTKKRCEIGCEQEKTEKLLVRLSTLHYIE